MAAPSVAGSCCTKNTEPSNGGYGNHDLPLFTLIPTSQFSGTYSPVVAALVLSFVVALIMEPPTPADCDACNSIFGESACKQLWFVYLISMQVLFFTCGCILYYSARVYSVLTVWLVTVESRLWFITESRRLLQVLNSSIFAIAILASIALSFGLFLIHPILGFVQVGIVVAVILIGFCSEAFLFSKAAARTHRDATRLLRYKDDASQMMEVQEA